MKFIFTILIVCYGLIITPNLYGQRVARQERENAAMSRLAKDQANSSTASRLLWGGLAVGIIVFGVWSMFKQARDKEKRQVALREEYQKKQLAIELAKKEKDEKAKQDEETYNQWKIQNQIEEDQKIKELKEKVDIDCENSPLLKHSMQLVYDNLNKGELSTAIANYETIKLNHQKFLSLISKYGDEIGLNLFNHKYWIGMTEEQLTDTKGSATSVEIEELKTKVKRILVYGNKSSGDVFTFENNLLTKFVDRDEKPIVEKKVENLILKSLTGKRNKWY